MTPTPIPTQQPKAAPMSTSETQCIPATTLLAAIAPAIPNSQGIHRGMKHPSAAATAKPVAACPEGQENEPTIGRRCQVAGDGRERLKTRLIARNRESSIITARAAAENARSPFRPCCNTSQPAKIQTQPSPAREHQTVRSRNQRGGLEVSMRDWTRRSNAMILLATRRPVDNGPVVGSFPGVEGMTEVYVQRKTKR
jgi:hypothetical protein